MHVASTIAKTPKHDEQADGIEVENGTNSELEKDTKSLHLRPASLLTSGLFALEEQLWHRRTIDLCHTEEDSGAGRAGVHLYRKQKLIENGCICGTILSREIEGSESYRSGRRVQC